MIAVALLTSALATKIKMQEVIKAEGEKERMRANLLRAISHDLRTPLTTIYGSSSASVGILQALSITGKVSYSAAIPIIMGQNIGTCITAILSSFGTNKNAKRAALVHLSFNVIGTIIWLTAFCIVKTLFDPILFDKASTLSGIAVAHSTFNILCTILLFPLSEYLAKLAYILVPENKISEKTNELDERLLTTPAIALERCHSMITDMGYCPASSVKDGIKCITQYDHSLAKAVRKN